MKYICTFFVLQRNIEKNEIFVSNVLPPEFKKQSVKSEKKDQKNLNR